MNWEITLSFTDIGKSRHCHDFLMSKICVLTVFAKIKIERKFTLPLFKTIVLCFLFGGLYGKQYRPRSGGSIWSSLIRVHSDCFHDRTSLKSI